MDLETWRQEFPVCDEWIYLNHAAVAPLCRPAAKAMRRLVRDAEENGMANYEDWNALYGKARRSCAALLACRPSEIALLKNTTEGILAVANGLRWRPGDNAVLAAGQFPANVYPWLNLEGRGVEIRQVEPVGGGWDLGAFASAIDDKTRIVSVSSVDFYTGARCDLEGLGALCRQRDSLFLVDAIQSLGAFPIDVKAASIDFVAADAHKWLLGPEGSALFYCSRAAQEKLDVPSLGWASVASAYDFLSYDRRLQPDARRFECGTLNTAGIAGLKAAVDFLLEIGLEQVSARITSHCDAIRAALAGRGYSVLGPESADERGGIVTFAHPAHDSEALAASLRAERVVSTVRGGHLRLSPHFYNSDDEIEKALSLLP